MTVLLLSFVFLFIFHQRGPDFCKVSMATTMILQIFWSVTLILSQVVIRIGCVSCDRPRKIIKIAEKEKKNC